MERNLQIKQTARDNITGLEASTITGLAKHTSHASIAVNMMESEKLF